MKACELEIGFIESARPRDVMSSKWKGLNRSITTQSPTDNLSYLQKEGNQ